MTDRFKAHFGHITYDVAYTDQPIVQRDGSADPDNVGKTRLRKREIEVLFTDEMTQEYAADSLLHEILHAALNAVGHQPEHEEEVVSAMTAGLMLFLRDPRNAGVLREVLGAPRLVIPAPPNPREAARQMAEAIKGGMIYHDEGVRFGSFDTAETGPYLDAARQAAREFASVTDPEARIADLENKRREHEAIITDQEEEATRLRGVVEEQGGWLRQIQEAVGPPGGSALTKMRQIRKVLLEAFPKDEPSPFD